MVDGQYGGRCLSDSKLDIHVTSSIKCTHGWYYGIDGCMDLCTLTCILCMHNYNYSHYYTDDVDAITVMVGDTNGKVKVYTCLGWELPMLLDEFFCENKAMLCKISISLTIYNTLDC